MQQYKVGSQLIPYLADRLPLSGHGPWFGGFLQARTTVEQLMTTLITIWDKLDLIQYDPFFVQCDEEIARACNKKTLSKAALRMFVRDNLEPIPKKEEPSRGYRSKSVDFPTLEMERCRFHASQH